MDKPQPLNLATHPLSGVTLIEASAGTGKTWTITHLYLRVLLERKLDIKQILVVTFTNAATQELRGRIRQLLYDVWRELNRPVAQDAVLDELFGQYRQQADVLLQIQQALVDFDVASIFSIHGFCQRVLNSFPVETHSLLQQEIIADEKEIRLSAVHDYWRRHINGLALDELQWVLKQWPDPEQLLQDVSTLLTDFDHLDKTLFDINALRVQWRALLQQWKKERQPVEDLLLNSGVFRKNSYKVEQLETLIEQFDAMDDEFIPNQLPDKFHLLTPQKMTASLLKGCSDERIGLAFFQLAEKFIAQHKNWLQQKKYNLLMSATIDVHDNILQSKRQAQAVSFDDLISQLSRALTTDNEALAQKIIDSWPMAMVDEFQDTDQRQYHIFKTLYHSAPAKASDAGLILIGDPKQAIYRFRGADVFTYQQAKQATGEQFTLEVNYRSTQDYIDMTNRLFMQNEQAFVFSQLIDFYPSQANPKSAKTLQDKNGRTLSPLTAWIAPFGKQAMKKDDANRYFATACANEIAAILNEQSMMLDGKPAQARDLAILVRTGRQASLMKQQLAQRGIGSALILRDSVFGSDQAREITLLLEVLIDPANIARLCGLLSSDLFGYDALQIDELQNDNRQLAGILEQIGEYRQSWSEQGILSMFFRLLEDQHSLARVMAGNDGERIVTNWLHIVELLQQQASWHTSLSQALHWLKQQRQQVSHSSNEEHQLRLESDSDLVRIVTIHKSKGLQYPVVFLPFMWTLSGSQKLPACYNVHDELGEKQLMILDTAEEARWRQENLAEEVRLLYVALTRAVYRCYLGFGHVSGAGSTALAQCLYSGAIKKAGRGYDLDVDTNEKLLAPFEILNADQQRVEIRQTAASNIRYSDKSSDQQLTAPRDFKRTLTRQWRITSYSQLALSASVETIDRPDYDAVQSNLEAADEAVSDTLSRFGFAKGAKAGTFLHDILEHQPFDQPVDESLIRRKCEEYGYEEEWLPCLSEWIEDVLKTDLNGFSLSRLRSQQCISEMEFYMSCDQLKATALNQLLHEQGYSQSPDAYRFSAITGYLKGFIDLVFEHDGQYFVADYKSNYLGTSVQDYARAQCEQAMFEHHYHLQYLIYTLALHRFLQQRLEDYDYERDVGGVYYLFLRGMSGTADCGNRYGVFFDKPTRALIEQLDRLFSE